MRRDTARHRNETFARRLHIALERTGISQAKLARLADIDQSSISRYLRGKCEPNLRQFRAIAIALRVRPIFLLGDGDELERVLAVPLDHDGHYYFVGGKLVGHWKGEKFACSCVELAQNEQAQVLLKDNGLDPSLPRAKRGRKRRG